MDDETDLNLYFTELVTAAQKALDNAEEAAKLYADGDTQNACNVVNVMHYKTSELEDLRRALVDSLETHGLTPRIDVS
jgi:hypothetical protein